MDGRGHAIERLRIGAIFLLATGAMWSLCEILAPIGMSFPDTGLSWALRLMVGVLGLLGLLCLGPPAYLLMGPAAWFARENRRGGWIALTGAIAYTLALVIGVAEFAASITIGDKLDDTLFAAIAVSIPPTLLALSCLALTISLGMLYRKHRLRGALVVALCCGGIGGIITFGMGAMVIELIYELRSSYVAWVYELGSFAAYCLLAIPPLMAIGSFAAFRFANQLITKIVLAHECPRCLYDMSARTGDVCPECGWRRVVAPIAASAP